MSTTAKIKDLTPYACNSRTHSDEQVSQIAASIREFGFTAPVLYADGTVIAGHGRLMAAQRLQAAGHRIALPSGEVLPAGEVPAIDCTGWSDAQKRAYVIADNKLALNAGWDDEMLRLELGELKDEGFDLDLTGFDAGELAALFDEAEAAEDEAGGGGDEASGAGSLAARFMIPPFTVLNAREGWWQDRKKAWLALGIKSEEGRGIEPTNVCKNTPEYMAGRGNNDGGSIFDPVMCELAYRWFSPVGGTVLDPFAGGSVRGIVASKLSRRYVGHELRAEQVEANRNQGAEICVNDDLPPVWICGDSRRIPETCADIHADMVFSCPPYADLEVYSDDPDDLSTLGYQEFKSAYRDIIAKACARLKNDRFACFIVGDVRDKRGNYYNFVGDTVQAFQDAGLHYYNEAVLVTAVGSLPIRAGKQFSSGRKLGKTHQNVLVFVKGDGKRAAQACGTVDVSDDCFNLEAADEGDLA